jgi:lipopolysaccharide transport system ATP-binding protein
MGDDIVIRAEGLGKKYVIGHETERERYVALRDVIARGARNAWRMAGDMVHGRVVVPGDTVEDLWALKDVSFEVKRGEVLGIIGRNGAGKSTLLKILSRITEPTEGRVTIKGRVASLLEVGTGFHPELTGRENIFLNGAILGMTRAEIKRKFDEIVAFAEVEKFLDTPVKRYSSGMYVRLAFAVAAQLESEILLVDEVLAVGDVEFQRKCLGKMSDVAHSGRTVLFVSHNMGSVAALCHNAIRMHAGHIVATGPVRLVIDSYLAMPISSVRTTFVPRKDKPSITGVRLDEEALRRGDFVAAVDFVSPFPLRPPIIGIVITNQTGIPVWGTNGRFHPWERTDFAVAKGTVICEAKGLPLAPAEYRLSAWLSDWHQDYQECPDALSFEFHVDANTAQRPSPQAIGNLDWVSVWRMATVDESDNDPCAVATVDVTASASSGVQ